VAVLFVASAYPVSAQMESPDTLPPPTPRWEVGLAAAMAVPTGAFATYVGLGGGFGLYGARYIDEGRHVAIRLDVAWIVYGHETIRVPLSPTIPFVDVDVTTENGIGSIAIGPEVVFGGGAVTPWFRASVGISDFATTTSVKGTSNEEPFATSTNFDDAALALSAGGGLRISLSRGSHHPTALDLGIVHIWHGETEYLREGGITTDASGGARLDTIRSRANLFAIHLGIAVGL
jgi:hypothetical protein